ncbi:hypothetical protein [Vibrio sp. ZOR0018]|uniref:hypothetical protein n=1 Tax=Vibrio sp. ZOR0018 TaxID=1339225 RepID=UPI0006456D76|nr:hypothetical protein [Vibrio sp. ZOR0018]
MNDYFRAFVEKVLGLLTPLNLHERVQTLVGILVILGSLGGLITGPLLLIRDAEIFKEHLLSVNVIRSQEKVTLDKSGMIGSYLIFNNKGDYEEIITRVSMEFYTPYQVSSVYLGGDVPNILPITIGEELGKSGEVKELLANGNFIERHPSMLPNYVSRSDSENVIAFGRNTTGGEFKHRWMLYGCNNPVKIRKNINNTVVINQFKLPQELVKEIEAIPMIIETGVFDDSIIGLIENGKPTMRLYLGELLVTVEFVNSNGRADRAIVDATNVYLEVNSDGKTLSLADWDTSFPDSFQKIVDIRTTENIYDRKPESLKYYSSIDSDSNNYLVKESGVPRSYTMPSMFANYDADLCQYTQVMSKN